MKKLVFIFFIFSVIVALAQNKPKANIDNKKVLGIVFDSADFTTIRHVVLGSAAHNADFKINDKIIKVNNVAIGQTNRVDFIAYLASLPDKISFELVRNYKTINLVATKDFKEKFLNKCINGNCQNGTGTFVYKDNSSFVGEFKEGKKVAGVWYFSNGNYYYGKLNNDKFEGYGEYHFWVNKNNFNQGVYYPWKENYYKGNYVNGIRNGQGEEKTAEFNYIGTFKDGKKQGQGWIKWKNDYEYKGEFANNKINGKGTYEKIRVNKYEGEFIDNNKSGKGRFSIYNDGRLEFLYDEVWDNGKLITKTELDIYSKIPKNKIASNNRSDNEPQTGDIYLGLAVVMISNGGGYKYYIYKIYGQKGMKLSKVDNDNLTYKVESLFYKMDQYQTLKHKVSRISFDTNVGQYDGIDFIRKVAQNNDDEISYMDIYEKGIYVLTRK